MEGVWKIILGAAKEEGLLSLGGGQADEALLQGGECPLAAARIECEQVRERFVLRIPLDPEERLYGLGLNFHKMTLNYGVRHLRADHYGGKDNGRTHAPVPFYVSDAGYGVFVDTAENISFYMGGAVRVDAENPPPELNRGRDENWRSNQDACFVEASFVGEGADVYLFAGDTMRKVVSLFNRLCGGGCLPPKWGLGFWHRMHIRHDAHAVEKELDEFKVHGLHVDVVGLEPGWQSNSYPCTLVWDRERFSDPAAFVQHLRKAGTRVNLWENMFISRKSSVYPDILPHSGSHQVWGGAVPDITLPAAREILLQHHENQRAGVSGYKVDECDGYDHWLWPDHARFPSGHSATSIRNVYGVRLQRMMNELFTQHGERTYGLVRATNAGAASLPFCVYNDCYDFDQFLTGLATAGFSGVLWVPEVRDSASPEEWVRRFQLSALSPMLMLNAWASGAKPWKFPEVEHIIADTIRFRRALLPYLYHAFYTYHKEGVPPFRPLVMDYASLRGGEKAGSGKLDDTKNPYEEKDIAETTDQFLIGESLMAAPMLPGQQERDVVLPPGTWYDFHTGEAVNDPVLRYACPLDRIPLFVREGGMIPLLQPDGSLLVRCFGERGECTLYDDDGETLNYAKGQYALLHMSFIRNERGVEGTYTAENMGWQSSYAKVIFA
ncbi:MAG: glycoside hydrolase family 31 protein [Clostridia bacterium]|nr:glycoside hydrolase family 31 protein [Clostridia bacterium]